MTLLVIACGGREHALACKLAQAGRIGKRNVATGMVFTGIRHVRH